MQGLRSSTLLWILLIIICIIGVGAFFMSLEGIAAPEAPLGTDAIEAAVPAPVGPPSPAVVQQLENSNGFQALVSYSNNSFQPLTTTIKQGQTVRFTNNAREDIWVAQITGENTVSDPNVVSCDSVFFDSCHALHPGDFFEVTFPITGTFYYMDNLNPSIQGTVVVQ